MKPIGAHFHRSNSREHCEAYHERTTTAKPIGSAQLLRDLSRIRGLGFKKIKILPEFEKTQRLINIEEDT